MQSHKLNTLTAIFLFLAFLLAPLVSKAKPGLLNFGNLLEKVQLDEKNNPVLDKDGNPIMLPMTDEEVKASVEKTLNPLLTLKKIGKIDITPDTVTIEINEKTFNSRAMSMEVNRKTGVLKADEGVLAKRSQTMKAISDSIAENRKTNTRLKEKIYQIKKSQEENKPDSQAKDAGVDNIAGVDTKVEPLKDAITPKTSKYATPN